MSTTHRPPTRGKDGSRQRSVDRYAEAPLTQIETPTKNAAGTKRLFSNRQSRLPYNSEDHGENDDHQSEDTGASYSDKRRRGSDWPLTNPSPLRDRYTSQETSPPSTRPSKHGKRPSKFQEGSMNNRVSQKPPVTYLDSDEFLDARYQGERTANGRKPRPYTFSHHPNSSLSVDTDVSRHTSIFRFGKSIAANFNPSNWKIWSKNQPEPEEDSATAQQRILRERQERAEKIYKELKQSGHFRDAQIPSQSYGRFGDNTLLSKHDSGVVIAETGRDSRLSVDSRKSREEKRMGVVFLEPPQLLGIPISASPASNTGSGNRSSTSSPTKHSFHFKKPSLNNIKRAFKDESLVDVSNTGDNQARRVPSRKDLQKQQKLVKRVSDLESKLEAARRQLNESLATPVPTQMPQRVGRSRFVPGAMPTLPSERLLSGYVESEGELACDEAEEIGKAVSLDEFRNASFGVDSTNRKEPLATKQSSLWDGKPLPPIAVSQHDQAVESIEVGDEGVDITHTVITSSQQSSGSSAFLCDDSVQKHDIEMDLEGRAASESDQISTLKAITSADKKRKSRFDPEDDNYKPTSETGSEPSSLGKETISRKKVASSTTRKLQKAPFPQSAPPEYPPPPPPTTRQTSIAHLPSDSTACHERPSKTVKPSLNADPSSTNHTEDSPQRRNTLKSKRAPSATSSSSTRQAKIKSTQRQPQIRQSVSPPPSSSFTGLQYAKPTNNSALSQISSHSTNKRELDAVASKSKNIPPMPKLPTAVRLPSGEVVNVNASPVKDVSAGNTTASASPSRSRGSKLVKSRREGKAVEVSGQEMALADLPNAGFPAEGNGRMWGDGEAASRSEMTKSQSKASFEWPEDCF